MNVVRFRVRVPWSWVRRTGVPWIWKAKRRRPSWPPLTPTTTPLPAPPSLPCPTRSPAMISGIFTLVCSFMLAGLGFFPHIGFLIPGLVFSLHVSSLFRKSPSVFLALLNQYRNENNGQLPERIIVYRTMEKECDMWEVTDPIQGELQLTRSVLAELATGVWVAALYYPFMLDHSSPAPLKTHRAVRIQ